MKHRKQPAAGMKPFFKAAVNTEGTLEILIYEEIGEDFWSYDGGLTAKTVRAKIDEVGTFSRILIRINSPGGDAFEGVAIGNVIRATKKPVDVCIDGIAASAASVVAMCGDTITMGHNAMMMVHNAWSMCAGEASDMRKMADTLDKVSLAIGQTYADRTGKSMDEVKALMDAETWLTADECVAEGFATAIADSENGPQALAMAKRFKSLAHMKKLPETLKAAAEEIENDDACECSCQSCSVDGECRNCTMEGCVDPNCTDCPMQSGESASASAGTAPPAAAVETPQDTNLSLYEARLGMLRRAR